VLEAADEAPQPVRRLGPSVESLNCIAWERPVHAFSCVQRPELTSPPQETAGRPIPIVNGGSLGYAYIVNHDDGCFDQRVAAVYDSYEDREEFAAKDIEATVDFLAELAGTGPALEFGIGTGRIGLPLSQRGVPTQGIDLSRPMVARLRGKRGGEDVAVTIGDFATTSVEGSFELVYLICNTIMNLTTREAQIACFQNAAAHLRPGGHFVVKVMVPELQWLPPGTTLHVFARSDNHWGIDEYDVATQHLVSHHFDRTGDGRFELSSPRFRYVWPSELDLMAELAGMRLLGRWEWWRREPFTSDSRKHVSAWEKPKQ
jgi:SAM-dependent methyltransferase